MLMSLPIEAYALIKSARNLSAPDATKALAFGLIPFAPILRDR